MKKLLIVDDSKAMRMIVRRSLQQVARIGEHEIVESTNGEDALQKLRTDRFDLVLADWNMPQMSGLELLRAIRAEHNDVKFGFVTSEGTDDVRSIAMDAGAQFLIVKPFTPEALDAALSPIFRT
jgi:two-component system chemotaxis response regulator CheY